MSERLQMRKPNNFWVSRFVFQPSWNSLTTFTFQGVLFEVYFFSEKEMFKVLLYLFFLDSMLEFGSFKAFWIIFKLSI